MKIICFIDSLNSGGAQRQITALAVLLKDHGFDVELLVYHDFNFFDDVLKTNEVPVNIVNSGSKIGRIFKIHSFLKERRPDVLVAFLRSPAMIAEISSAFDRNYKLIVSERSLGFEGAPFRSILRYFLHLLSDAVVTNSYSQEQFIMNVAPWLRDRLITITNCVDLEKFHPAAYPEEEETKFCVIGRYEREKQPFSIVSALKKIRREHPENQIQLDWYGNNFFINGDPTPKSETYLHLKAEIAREGLQEKFRLQGTMSNITEVYHGSSALLLPSRYEGCSNVICEAMACGKPVLASRVGDNVFLVEDEGNGFLFDPKSYEDMAEKMLKFASLTPEEKQKMGEAGREKAMRLLSPERLSNEFVQLIQRLSAERSSLFREEHGKT